MRSGLAIGFRPPWWGVCLAAIGCAAGIALGNWQVSRAADKRALAAEQKLQTLRGVFEPKYTVLLDNKMNRGRPGYHVVQPMRLPGGSYVLVDRGWVAMKADRGMLPDFRTPPAEVVLEGIRMTRFARAYEPAGTRLAGVIWQNVTIEQFGAWSGLALEPWVFEQHSPTDDGLARERPRADTGVGKHDSYALQWYALSALSVVLLIVLNLKREPRS
jgi:surfeit locus 1 family protein